MIVPLVIVLASPTTCNIVQPFDHAVRGGAPMRGVKTLARIWPRRCRRHPDGPVILSLSTSASSPFARSRGAASP